MDVLGIDVSECVRPGGAQPRRRATSTSTFSISRSPATCAGRQFDYIVGNGILHHLYYNLPTALFSMRGLLAPNGRVIFLNLICTIHTST